MNIYLLKQDEVSGYDTYDAMVVCSSTPELAALLHPRGEDGWCNQTEDWCSNPGYVTVKYLGKANDSLPKHEVILTSFNAG